MHARNVFNVKYESNIVTWKGYFAESKIQAGVIPFIGSGHAMNFLIKMDPSESPLYPDLVMSLSSKLMNEKSQIIKNLKKGDEIKFKAQIVTLGNEFKLHHLHGEDFEMTGGFKELNDIIVRESTLP